MEVRIITNAYKLSKDARDASWRCLINTGAAEMPIKVLKVAAFCGVKVVRDSNAHYLKSGESGCTLVDSAGAWQIVYKDTENRGRTRFTVAHELGHILLGHELAPDKSGHFRTGANLRRPRRTSSRRGSLLLPACSGDWKPTNRRK